MITVVALIALAAGSTALLVAPPTPRIADQYSAGFVEVISQPGMNIQVFEGRFYMDYINNRSRIDVTGFAVELSIFWDFQEGPTPAITFFAGQSYCINSTMPEWTNPRDLERNLVFIRSEVKNGVMCDMFSFNLRNGSFTGDLWFRANSSSLVAENFVMDDTTVNMSLWDIHTTMPSDAYLMPPVHCINENKMDVAPPTLRSQVIPHPFASSQAVVRRATAPPKPNLPMQYSTGFFEIVTSPNQPPTILQGHMYMDYVSMHSRIDISSFGSELSLFWSGQAGVSLGVTFVGGRQVCVNTTMPQWISPKEIQDSMVYIDTESFYGVECDKWSFAVKHGSNITSGLLWLQQNTNIPVYEFVQTDSLQVNMTFWGVTDELPDDERFFTPPISC